jgi:hypothetical protein
MNALDRQSNTSCFVLKAFEDWLTKSGINIFNNNKVCASLVECLIRCSLFAGKQRDVALWRNVFHRYFDHPKPQFIKYDDSDSEVNHVTYLLCDMSRSLILWISRFERSQNEISSKIRDENICFVSAFFSYLSTRDWDQMMSNSD